ncbi:hypothetical protein PYCCODRAFT_1472669 [Trametes coccinea BRFM310]|uniref:Uncharacterized protein n=1 Tax=Trametes coccinea (strain BRFM310) TaxID=1353009 RepID=A0A1Y2I7E5_TRAC3|nr:hypothetical protein PYCCODRAFT_1472669 [Trametes coccinea BRFM310]
MASDDHYVYVDDDDSRIVVSDNWGVSSISYAYDGTLHGASVADATATFTFTGTAVSVVGGIGAVSEYGWPSSSYAIDGKVVGTYNLVTDGQLDDYNQFAYNFTYFNSPVLSAGKHTLVITTLNGTKPNTYWLDYIRFLPPGSTGSTSSASATASGSASFTFATGTSESSPTHSSTPTAGSVSTSPAFTSGAAASTSLPASGNSLSSSSATSPSSTQSSSQSGRTSSTPSSALPPSPPSATGSQSSHVVAGASSHSSHVGAIIGGAVGGAVLLALLAILGVYFYLRRRTRVAYGGDLMTDRMYYDAPPGPGAPITHPTEATSFLPGTPASASPTSAAFLGQPIVPATPEPNHADVVSSQPMRKDRTGFTSSNQLRPGTPLAASASVPSSVGHANDSASGSSIGLIVHSGEESASSEVLLPAKAAHRAIAVQEVDSGFRVPVGSETLPPPYTPD